MLNKYWLRDTLRSRRIRKYEAANGSTYHYHGMQVELPDAVGIGPRNAILRNKYEASEIGFIKKYIGKNLPVIELGGSLGVISRYIGTRLADDTTLVVVEANPTIFDICKKNATIAQRAASTVLINKAVAYGSPTVSFQVDDNVHSNRLAQNNDTASDGSVTVDAVSLNDLLLEHAPDQDYAIVMDIEGGEFNIIDNDIDAFARCQLAIIEVHPQYATRADIDFDYITKKLAAVSLQLVERDEDVFVYRRSN